MNLPKLAFSLTEFADAHSVGRSTIYKEIHSGRLKVSKVGRRTIITLEQAAAWRASVGGADERAA